MANLMDKMLGFVRAQRKNACARQVVYRFAQGGEAVCLATIGKSLFRVDDINGITTRTRSLDFIIEADELPREPQRGDGIIYQDKLFEVNAPDGEPCWHWSGDDCRTYRIHAHSLGEDAYKPMED